MRQNWMLYEISSTRSGLTTLNSWIPTSKLRHLWQSTFHPYGSIPSIIRELELTRPKGSLSLSQANFKNSHRSRYGQDYFDGRMKASRRCGFEVLDVNQVRVSIIAPTAEHDDPVRESTSDAEAAPKQQPSPPATPAPDDEFDQRGSRSRHAAAGSDAGDGLSDERVGKTEASKRLADPLRWFGILVPRELRCTQVSWTAAVEESCIDAVNAARAMREYEIEIRRLRKTVKKAERPTV